MPEKGFALKLHRKDFKRSTPAPVDRTVKTGLSMLDSLYNLECPSGHRHYSPRPDRFVGAKCGLRGTDCADSLKRIPVKAG